MVREGGIFSVSSKSKIIIKMIVIAILLLIAGLSKLAISAVSNKMEVKELAYNTPVFVDVPPEYIRVLITADGLINVFGSIALFCYLW